MMRCILTETTERLLHNTQNSVTFSPQKPQESNPDTETDLSGLLAPTSEFGTRQEKNQILRDNKRASKLNLLSLNANIPPF